jgi:hypothetical protein
MQQFFDLHRNTIRLWFRTGAVCFAVYMIYAFGHETGRQYPFYHCAERHDTITDKAAYQRCVVRMVERR